MSISIKPAKRGEALDLGVIRFGKPRPDKTKYVMVDIHYDKRAGLELHRVGLELLREDREAVVEYVVTKAIRHTASLQKQKRRAK